MGNSPCFSGMSKPNAKFSGGMSPMKVSIGHWKFRGLGAPLRMMCVYSVIDWEEHQFDIHQHGGRWVSVECEQKKNELRKSNPLVRVPYLVNHATGEVVSQPIAIYLYLGRTLGLDGATDQDKFANDQILCFMYGMSMDVCDLVYPFKGVGNEHTFKACLQPYFSRLRVQYERLETWLEQHGDASFFAGLTMSSADFLVWELLDQHEVMATDSDIPSPLGDYKLLKAFFYRVRQEPRLQPYFESEDYKLPINNVMAFFK